MEMLGAIVAVNTILVATSLPGFVIRKLDCARVGLAPTGCAPKKGADNKPENYRTKTGRCVLLCQSELLASVVFLRLSLR